MTFDLKRFRDGLQQRIELHNNIARLSRLQHDREYHWTIANTFTEIAMAFDDALVTAVPNPSAVAAEVSKPQEPNDSGNTQRKH